MKIAIITRWGTKNNYGQVLQNYALQKYLKKAGHDPYVIRFNYGNADTPRSLYGVVLYILKLNIKVVSYVISRFNQYLYDKERKDNNFRKFDEFRNTYTNQSEKIYNSYSELVENPPNADLYITGSDQVFAIERVELKRALNRLRAFYLDFGSSETTRIAYSASFGASCVEAEYKEKLLPLLKNFKYISVREQDGVEICRQAGFDSVECVPDPTLLLSPNEYDELILDDKINMLPKRKYCLLYLLGREDNFKMRLFKNWASKRNLDIVYVASSNKYDRHNKCYPTISEWLRLIKNAECVITHSYHCAVFSVLFKKQFAIIPQISRDKGQNTRLDTLFQMIQIAPRYVLDTFDIVDEPVEWDKVHTNLALIRDKTVLSKIIDSEFKL